MGASEYYLLVVGVEQRFWRQKYSHKFGTHTHTDTHAHTRTHKHRLIQTSAQKQFQETRRAPGLKTLGVKNFDELQHFTAISITFPANGLQFAKVFSTKLPTVLFAKVYTAKVFYCTVVILCHISFYKNCFYKNMHGDQHVNKSILR